MAQPDPQRLRHRPLGRDLPRDGKRAQPMRSSTIRTRAGSAANAARRSSTRCRAAKSMSWPMVVRTAVMDEIILRCVQQGARTVLNLAAGLDARPYRLTLPPTLRWLHVDLPDMVDYFRERMAGETPRCELEFITADLREPAARRDVFAHAAAQGPVLVITEGLLVYLEPDEVVGTRARPARHRARQVVADRPRLADAAEVPRKAVAAEAARKATRRSGSARGRHRVLRAIRLAAKPSSVPPGMNPCA